MAPPGSAKRKRPDRQYSQEDGAGRPSPHRPENLPMAHHNSHSNPRGGSRGRGPRRIASQAHGSSSASSTNTNTITNTPTPSSQYASTTPQTDIQPKSATAAEPQPPPDPRRSVLPPMASVNDEPEEPPRPYAYDYVTDEVVQGWNENGKSSLRATFAEQDTLAKTVTIAELVRSGLDARLKPEVVGAMISEFVAQGHEDRDSLEVQSTFLDVISLLDEKDQRRRALYHIVAASGIDPHDIRHNLDVALLQSLQLVRTTFNQMRTRKTTNVLYRQANYNLLREESEGYAKLITDFYNASQDANSEGADPQMGKEAFHRIMALVGAFDLDVGRVLDVIMDISANTLVKTYRFFLKFYRYSSWWPDNSVLDNIQWTQEDLSGVPSWALPDSGKWQYDEQDKVRLQAQRQQRDERFWTRVAEHGMKAFFELGARRIIDYEAAVPLLEQVVQPELDAKGREVNADKRNRINESRKYMLETKILPPLGNSDAAQLLGFKLRFYASSVRDKTDVLPENLIYLAALLIKVGFISLKDLYPHLYPADDAMEQEKARLEKEKEEKERKDRPGGGMNALAMAAALPDDTIPTVRTLRTDNARSGGTTPKPEKKEDVPVDELPPPVNQKLILLKALLAIGALPEALFILGKFPWLVEVDISLAPYLLRIVKQMLSKLTAQQRQLVDEQDAQATRSQLLDTHVASDGTLKLAPRHHTRIRKWLGLESVDSGDGFAERHYYTDWDENIPICQSVDDFFVLCNTFINFLGVKVGLDTGILSTMLRLARSDLAENSSVTNRSRWLDLIKRLILPALSLVKHNPGLTQELYSLLSTFSITTRYSLYEELYMGKTSRIPDVKSAFNRNRAEVKDVLRRITNESGKKMARALGKVTYSSPGIVMTTFINQLESYSNMIPGLVESVRYFTPFAWDTLTWVLIRSLSGQGRDRIQADGMLTSPWLQALSQFVASLFTRYGSINPSPVLQYIAFELRSGDSTDLELVDQVITEMAGIRSDMNFNEIQILAMTGGEALQSVIVQQLADTRHLRKSSAKRLMKALSDPGITAQILISIAQERQMYAHRETAATMPLKVLGNNLDKIQQVFAQYLELLRINMTPADFTACVPDVFSLVTDFGIEPSIAFTISRVSTARRMAQSDAIRRKRAKQAGPSADEDAAAGDVTEAEERDYIAAATIVPESKDLNTWYPFFEETSQRLAVTTIAADSKVGSLFYTVFWSFAPEHVNAPLNIYEDEIKRINAQLDLATRDRSSTSAAAIKEKEKKCTSLKETLTKLRGEMSSRVSVFGDTKKWFAAKKKEWFPLNDAEDEVDQRHLHILQECFLPRALLSSLDAQYCFSILKTLHSVGTYGFSIVSLLNQLMRPSLLSSIIFQSTARETENFGRFLCEVLRFLSAWHADKALYEKEAHGSRRNLVGFASRVDTDGTPLDQLEYEDFRRKLFEWHNALKDSLKTCFESGEYMHIRNGIVLLKSICTVYPSLKFHGKSMQDLLKSISTNDTRDDLKLAALSLQGPLKVREKKWIIVQDFKMSGGSNDVTMADADQDDTETGAGGKLNAQAVEFKPGSSVTDGRNGAEDGEIEDEKEINVIDKADVPNGSASADIKPPAESASKAATIGDGSSEHTESVKTEQDGTARNGTARGPTPVPTKASGLPEKLGSDSGSRTPSSSRPAAPDRSATRPDERFGRLDRPSETRQSAPRDPHRRPGAGDNSREQSAAPMDKPGRRHERSPGRPLPSQTSSFREDHQSGNKNGDRRVADVARHHEHNNRDRASAPSGGREQMRSETTQAGPASRSQSQSNATEMSSVVAQPSINPARAALINNESSLPNGGRNERPDPRANGRTGNSDNTQRGPSSRTEATPTGPKASRGAGGRDLFEANGGRNNTPEQNRGRLSRDSTHGQAPSSESSYGRLNGTQDMPPVPRTSNGLSGSRSTRHVESSAPAIGPRQSEIGNKADNATRAPESPSSRRSQRGRAGDGERPGSSMRAEQTSLATPSHPATPASESGPAVHPSRLANLGVDTNVAQAGARGAGSPPSAPSGPRSHNNRPPPGTPTGPSPTNNIPTGPGFSNERQRRSDRSRPSGNQSSLAGDAASSNQGIQFRGAARQGANNASVATSAEQPRVLTSSMDAPPPRPDNSSFSGDRVDRGRAEMMQRGAPGDTPSGNRGVEGAGRYDGQRQSRNSSRERRFVDGGPRSSEQYGNTDGQHMDGRHDRARESHGYPDEGMRGGRGSLDGAPRRPGPPPAPGSYAGPPPPQDWNRPGYNDRGPSRAQEDFRAHRRPDSGAGRGGFAPGPASEVEGRKRRHEDAQQPAFDGAKRRRSGR